MHQAALEHSSTGCDRKRPRWRKTAPRRRLSIWQEAIRHPRGDSRGREHVPLYVLKLAKAFVPLYVLKLAKAFVPLLLVMMRAHGAV
jgi:hypothetical protein